VVLQHLGLTLLERRQIELCDQLAEQAVPVDLGLKPQEDRAQSDRRTIHDDERSRHLDPSGPVELGDHALGGIAPPDLGRSQARPTALVLMQRNASLASMAACGLLAFGAQTSAMGSTS
jgi:hypothetical protein